VELSHVFSLPSLLGRPLLIPAKGSLHCEPFRRTGWRDSWSSDSWAGLHSSMATTYSLQPTAYAGDGAGSICDGGRG
jgi:hypothetical protein